MTMEQKIDRRKLLKLAAAGALVVAVPFSFRRCTDATARGRLPWSLPYRSAGRQN